jgi:hypothetical protein
MKYYQEVTEWPGGSVNHIYYLKDDRSKMVGYIRNGTTELYKFKQPIDFYTKGRKFVKLDRPAESDRVYFSKTEESPPSAGEITVTGSSGQIYRLTPVGEGYRCSCPGFQFRRRCTHVDTVKLS